MHAAHDNFYSFNLVQSLPKFVHSWSRTFENTFTVYRYVQMYSIHHIFVDLHSKYRHYQKIIKIKPLNNIWKLIIRSNGNVKLSHFATVLVEGYTIIKSIEYNFPNDIPNPFTIDSSSFCSVINYYFVWLFCTYYIQYWCLTLFRIFWEWYVLNITTLVFNTIIIYEENVSNVKYNVFNLKINIFG